MQSILSFKFNNLKKFKVWCSQCLLWHLIMLKSAYFKVCLKLMNSVTYIWPTRPWRPFIPMEDIQVLLSNLARVLPILCQSGRGTPWIMPLKRRISPVGLLPITPKKCCSKNLRDNQFYIAMPRHNVSMISRKSFALLPKTTTVSLIQQLKNLNRSRIWITLFQMEKNLLSTSEVYYVCKYQNLCSNLSSTTKDRTWFLCNNAPGTLSWTLISIWELNSLKT